MKRAKTLRESKKPAEEEVTLSDILSDGIASDDSLCSFIADFKPKRKRCRKITSTTADESESEVEIPSSTPFKWYFNRGKLDQSSMLSPIGKQKQNATSTSERERSSKCADNDSDNDSSDGEWPSPISESDSETSPQSDKWNFTTLQGKQSNESVLSNNAAKFRRKENLVPSDQTRIEPNKGSEEKSVDQKKTRLEACINKIKKRDEELNADVLCALDAFDFALECLRNGMKLPRPSKNLLTKVSNRTSKLPPENALTSHVDVGQYHHNGMKSAVDTSPRNNNTLEKEQLIPAVIIEPFSISQWKESNEANIRRSGRVRKPVKRTQCVVVSNNSRFVSHLNNVTGEHGVSDLDTMENPSVSKLIKKTVDEIDINSNNTLSLKNNLEKKKTVVDVKSGEVLEIAGNDALKSKALEDTMEKPSPNKLIKKTVEQIDMNSNNTLPLKNQSPKKKEAIVKVTRIKDVKSAENLEIASNDVLKSKAMTPSPKKLIKKTVEKVNINNNSTLPLKNQSPEKRRALVKVKHNKGVKSGESLDIASNDVLKSKGIIPSPKKLRKKTVKKININNNSTLSPKNISKKKKAIVKVKRNKAKQHVKSKEEDNDELDTKSGVIEIQPDGEIPRQCLKHYDVLYRVDQGQAHMTLNNCHRLLAKNETAVVHKGNWYSIKNIDKRKKLLMHFCELLTK